MLSERGRDLESAEVLLLKRLRGLVARDRALHGVMARAAWEVLRESLSEAASEREGAPGAVISLQTFGSFGANFHPHLHAIVTEGVFTKDGRFHPVIWPTPARLEMRFRRRFLGALVEAGRLRAETRARFLAWSRSGFSVDATHRVAAGERERAERLARYATRVVLATGKVRRLEGGRVRVETPPDPWTGRTWLELDELELVHAVCQQVPSRGRHLVHYYGVYANRLRRAFRAARAARGRGRGRRRRRVGGQRAGRRSSGVRRSGPRRRRPGRRREPRPSSDRRGRGS